METLCRMELIHWEISAKKTMVINKICFDAYCFVLFLFAE